MGVGVVGGEGGARNGLGRGDAEQNKAVLEWMARLQNSSHVRKSGASIPRHYPFTNIVDCYITLERDSADL